MKTSHQRYLELLKKKIKDKKKRKLGGGGRFELIKERARKYGARNPAAVAAAAGIRKYGKRKMAEWAHKK